MNSSHVPREYIQRVSIGSILSATLLLFFFALGNLASGQPAAARTAKLSCHKPFATFLAEELLPWIRARYRVTSVPTETIIGGASHGGLAAICAALAGVRRTSQPCELARHVLRRTAVSAR